MVWISLDELLEKIMLKLYKQWDRPLLGQVRPLLDDERLQLASALRTLASANVNQSEDAMILYLERLATLETTVRLLAQEEFDLLPEVKQAVQRARRPSMRLRGYRPKPTNLSPARMQTLLALLEALDPPAYAVTRMFFPEDLGRLSMLLESALVMVFDAWEELALETRGAVLRSVHAMRVGLMQDDEQLVITVRSAVETLHQFEAMPEVMEVARDAFLMGKVDTPPESPFRFNAMIVISQKLADMLTDPPPISTSAAQSPDQEEEAAAPPQEEPAAPPATPPAETLPPPDLTPVIEPVQPGLAPRRPTSQAIERDFYTDVRFPQQVRAGDEVPLIVRLTRSPFAFSRVDGQTKVEFDTPSGPEYVEVVVVAHGFEEATATWSRTLAVYVDRDSQPALFLLRAGMELGEKRVTLDFYHKDRYLSSAAFTTRIVEKAPAAVGGVTVDTPALAARFVDDPPPPADLELRIVRGLQDNVLQFMLHSSKPGVGYHWRPMGQIQLDSATPQSYMESLFSQLGESGAQPVDQLSEPDAPFAAEDLDRIGQQLFRQLFPPELQQEFWARILPRRRSAQNPEGVIGSLLITSDEPWIPWEMVKPVRVDPATDREQSAGFLAESFQVSRWLTGRSPADEVHVKAAALVAPETGLAYAEREEAYFRQLRARRVQVEGPLRSLDEVRELARAGGVQLLHLAAHGRFNGSNAELSPLTLDGGTLTPADLVGERVAGLRRERPLVFLNACHTARLAFALTNLGSWAERVIADVGASAFVGTLWEVNDLLAAEFAIVFYDRLLAGDTLGQAFYAARLAVRDRQPDNPTWLAYVLYGDPNSRVVWGSEEAVEAAAPEAQSLAVEEEVEEEPELDLDILTQMLQESLGDVLPDLVRQIIPQVVTKTMAHLVGEEEEQAEGAGFDEEDEAETHEISVADSAAQPLNETPENRGDTAPFDAQAADAPSYPTAPNANGNHLLEQPDPDQAATEPSSTEPSPTEPSGPQPPNAQQWDPEQWEGESWQSESWRGEKWGGEPWDEPPHEEGPDASQGGESPDAPRRGGNG